LRAGVHNVRIRSLQQPPPFDLSELLRYRDLIYLLARRDLAVRYKQTLLGIAWAVLQPVLAMLVFSVVFGQLAGLPSDGIPYPVFAYLGLLPWTYAASAVSRSASSLVSNAPLLGKVYFPRLILPLAAVVAPLVDLGLAFLVLVGLMAWYGITPSASLLLLLPLVALAGVLALGVGTAMAALSVRWRDLLHALPFLIQVWLYATPVVYPASLVPDRYRLLFHLNPMTGLVEGFRAAALGRPFELAGLALTAACVMGLLLAGVWLFRRAELTLSDVL